MFVINAFGFFRVSFAVEATSRSDDTRTIVRKISGVRDSNPGLWVGIPETQVMWLRVFLVCYIETREKYQIEIVNPTQNFSCGKVESRVRTQIAVDFPNHATNDYFCATTFYWWFIRWCCNWVSIIEIRTCEPPIRLPLALEKARPRLLHGINSHLSIQPIICLLAFRLQAKVMIGVTTKKLIH